MDRNRKPNSPIHQHQHQHDGSSIYVDSGSGATMKYSQEHYHHQPNHMGPGVDLPSYGGSRAVLSPPPGFSSYDSSAHNYRQFLIQQHSQNLPPGPGHTGQYQNFYVNSDHGVVRPQTNFASHSHSPDHNHSSGFVNNPGYHHQHHQPTSPTLLTQKYQNHQQGMVGVGMTMTPTPTPDFGNTNNKFHQNQNNDFEVFRGNNPNASQFFQTATNMPRYTLVQPPPPSAENENKMSSNGVIKPLIDNIVGSMISNGTYTHFGPSSNIITAFPSEYQESMTMTMPSVPRRTPPFDSPTSTPENILSNEKRGCDSGKESPVIPNPNSAVGQGRASTPSDGGNDANSRPQTPSKPSYSEILAKNSSTSGSGSGTSSQSSVKASTSTSPASAPSLAKGSTSRDTTQNSVPNYSYRKVDATNPSAGSSATSSSCASSSSSPVSRQKTFSQSIVGRLFNTSGSYGYGKENSVDFNKSQNRTTTITPSGTPTHQKKSGSGSGSDIHPKNDRKVLSSSQNSFAGSNNRQKEKEKAKPKAGKTPSGTDGTEYHFEHHQQQDGLSNGWKTFPKGQGRYAQRDRSSLSSAVGGSKTSLNEIDIDDSSIASGSAASSKSELNGSDENESESGSTSNRRESLTEKKSSSSNVHHGGAGGQTHKKLRDKEKPKSRRDGRNCAVRRMERIGYLWMATMISAVAWLVKLVTDVLSLSVSVGSTLVEDLYSWVMNKALPTCSQHIHAVQDKIRMSWRKLRRKMSWKMPFRRKSDEGGGESKKNSEDLLAALGPDRNIMLPSNGDEALTRLLSCKGQDPYSILGVRSDSSDETIRRYYKKLAVLVHPDKNLVVGAEEAFKILARAFELVGDPKKRQEYHNQLLEAHAKEQVYGEIGKLLEQLRKKMEIATSSIRCTKCNLRHKKNKTDRPLFAARYCGQCAIHHGAREGELWAEKKGWFGLTWNYFTCMDSHIWEINEWAKCQKKNLEHIKADSHCVMYRLVAGGNNQSGQNSGGNANTPGPGPGQEQDGQFQMDPNGDWDTLINNFCKNTGGVPGGKPGSHFYQQSKNGGGGTGTGTNNFYPGGSSNTSSNAGRKRKGRRK